MLGLFQSEDSLLRLFIFLVAFHSGRRLASELLVMLDFLVEKYCTLPSFTCIRMLLCELVAVCATIASTLLRGKQKKLSYGMCRSFELATQSSIEEEDTLRTAQQSRRTVKAKQASF